MGKCLRIVKFAGFFKVGMRDKVNCTSLLVFVHEKCGVGIGIGGRGYKIIFVLGVVVLDALFGEMIGHWGDKGGASDVKNGCDLSRAVAKYLRKGNNSRGNVVFVLDVYISPGEKYQHPRGDRNECEQRNEGRDEAEYQPGNNKSDVTKYKTEPHKLIFEIFFGGYNVFVAFEFCHF